MNQESLPMIGNAQNFVIFETCVSYRFVGTQTLKRNMLETLIVLIHVRKMYKIGITNK